ncbi:PRD domain-containing protein [Bacillus sp. JJ1533]|uniref:BglG family transcription antiterminator LicT n=1 Tax=Bacillus sp. JJ1533 TaxID=3122959 RepID=UPI002FFF9654
MKIEKVLNNNVVMCRNESDQEIVAMGKGLAFQRKSGDIIDVSKVEKTFILQKHGIVEKLAKLLEDTSELYLSISSKVLEYAKTQLPNKLDDFLYVALTDHLSFAISRHKQGIQFKNALLWEIRKYYKKEFQVALKALDIIEQETGIRLDENEAASIALHLVNGQVSGDNMAATIQITQMVNDILNIVKYHFKMELDETSLNYERFLTHLRFFGMRYMRNEKSTDFIDDFFHEQIKLKYSDAYACTQKVATYLNKEFGWEISKEEEIYLTVHIHRVTNRHLLNQKIE